MNHKPSMKKARLKRSKPKPRERKLRAEAPHVNTTRMLDSKPRSGKRIKSVRGAVARWEVTSRKVELEQTFGDDIFEADLADAHDMEAVRTDLATLAAACDLLRDLAEEQAKRLAHLEARLANAESATMKKGVNLVAQLGGLERLLGGEVIPQALKQLCDQQLTAIDERMTALQALETRVRELVKHHAI